MNSKIVPSMLHDPRPIKSIEWGIKELYFIDSVGKYDVTKILPYLEQDTIWLAVYQGNYLCKRVPANLAIVYYED